MIIIPGKIFTVLTFPGVVMHEISHRLMCDILKIPVYEVCYVNIESRKAGYVIHHKTDNLTHCLLIGLAPLFINSIMCMILTFPLNASIDITGEANFFHILLWWIGFSMGANAFPSDQDVSKVLDIAHERNLFKVSLICSIVQFLNRMSEFWADFIYAYLISLILPYLIFGELLIWF